MPGEGKSVFFNGVIPGISVTLQSPQQSADANYTNDLKKQREGGVRKSVKLGGKEGGGIWEEVSKIQHMKFSKNK